MLCLKFSLIFCNNNNGKGWCMLPLPTPKSPTFPLSPDSDLLPPPHPQPPNLPYLRQRTLHIYFHHPLSED